VFFEEIKRIRFRDKTKLKCWFSGRYVYPFNPRIGTRNIYYLFSDKLQIIKIVSYEFFDLLEAKLFINIDKVAL
jgi:hypothetical protein